MKKIVPSYTIDSCVECDYMELTDDLGYRHCAHPVSVARETVANTWIDNTATIPDWCPLEDAE